MSLEEVIIDNLGKIAAKDILVYDTKERSPFYDEMVIATVDSQRQADAVVAYLEEDCNKYNYTLRKVEGRGSSWVLVDCNIIIVSIFTKEERENFAIEKIYMDTPCREIKI